MRDWGWTSTKFHTTTKGVKGRTAISWVVTLPPIRLMSDKGTPRKTTTYKYIF